MSRTLRRHLMMLVAGIVVRTSLSTAADTAEPVLRELDSLPNGDQPISLELDRVSAAEALSAIAAASRLHVVIEGSTDCCVVNLCTIDVPLRRTLELLAAQIDARYQVSESETLHVWLPEILMPEGENGITPPVVVSRADPAYPKDAREARAGGRVVMQAVIRYDGTVGSVTVLSHAERWPSIHEAAVAAVRKRIYRPATKNGEPVSVFVTISVAFSLD